MKRLFILLALPLLLVSCDRWFEPSTKPSKHVFYYTTIDGETIHVNLGLWDGLAGTRVLSNTYENGIGKIVFNRDLNGIGDMFRACHTLETMTLPTSITHIDEHAFDNCGNLISVAMSENVAWIGEHAFSGCKKLADVNLPPSVKEIKEWAYMNCESLTEVALHEGLESLGDGAFENCTNLTCITMPNSITSLGSGLFAGCI